MRKIFDFLADAAEYIIYEINWDFWGTLIVTYILLQLFK